jgi:hypothetical protein
MKTIKIGETDYFLTETAEELSIKRYTELEALMVFKITGVQIPSLVEAMRGFIAGFDENSKSKMLISLKDYHTGLLEIQNKNNADQLIYSLIVLEENEDSTEYNAGLAKEKLERMNKDGLTQKVVRETVDAFIVASPLLYAQSLLMSLEGQKTKQE